MRRIIIGLLVCTLAIIPGFRSEAAEVDMVELDSVLTSDVESTYEINPIMRYSYLMTCRGTITNPAIGYVGASASTYASTSVPSISVTVFVQRYNGSSWTTIANWKQSATNKAYVGTEKTLSVTRGYYYRVYSVHNANGESNFGATNGIYIS